MLAGCFALSRALSAAPGQWKPLVALMGVLQLYEFVLLGLAVLLYRRVRMPSDARMAFLLGLLFVSDATYLNTELATSNPWAAPWVALAHLAFLVPKLIFLRDALGLTSLRTLALTVAQVAFLVYIPGTFSAVHFMVAVLFSTVYSDELVFTLGDSLVITPLRIALVGAAVSFWIHRSVSERPSFVWASILTTSLAVSGPTFSAMRLRWTNLFPETYAEFGIVAVAVAFAMLLLALAVSLWRPRRPPEDRHPPMTHSRVARYAE